MIQEIVFADRRHAGRRLAERLLSGAALSDDVVVVAIPRGGVIVAAPVARALGAPLDIVVPRKIGAPREPEVAVGALAVVEGEQILLIDEAACRMLGVGAAYLREESQRQRDEIVRRLRAYRGDRPAESLAERTVVLVDDGIATGQTVRAAAQAIARSRPRELLVAVPVAPAETAETFAREGLRLEAVTAPRALMSVGQFYDDFHAVDDDEVRETLSALWHTSGSA